MSKLIFLTTHDQVTEVSDSDYEWLNQWKWRAHKDNRGGYYAARTICKNGKKRVQFMHKVILGIDNTKIKGDHIDGNKLRNVRDNLRKVNNSKNLQNRGKQRNNTSGYKGVHYFEKTKRYRAKIVANKIRMPLSAFLDPIQAAKMYDFWARDLHGEFANCNFPGKRVGIRKIRIDINVEIGV